MTFGIATGAFLDVRDDWDASVSRAVAGGWPFLELTAVTEDLLDSLRDFLSRNGDRLAPFERVSLHAPIVVRTSLRNRTPVVMKCSRNIRRADSAPAG